MGCYRADEVATRDTLDYSPLFTDRLLSQLKMNGTGICHGGANPDDMQGRLPTAIKSERGQNPELFYRETRAIHSLNYRPKCTTVLYIHLGGGFYLTRELG